MTPTSSGKQACCLLTQGEGSARSRHFRKEGSARKKEADRPVSPVNCFVGFMRSRRHRRRARAWSGLRLHGGEIRRPDSQVTGISASVHTDARITPGPPASRCAERAYTPAAAQRRRPCRAPLPPVVEPIVSGRHRACRSSAFIQVGVVLVAAFDLLVVEHQGHLIAGERVEAAVRHEGFRLARTGADDATLKLFHISWPPS